MLSPQDATEEVALVANILEKLLGSSPDGTIRKDQVDPLISRLRIASQSVARTFKKSNVVEKEPKGGADTFLEEDVEEKKTKLANKKPSSVQAKRVPRAAVPKERVRISKEVYHAITCSLYNILESCATLTAAASATVFIRVGEEMVSIANVAQRLTFPPQLVRHHCLGSDDAEVLGSAIGLNRRTQDVSRGSASVLIFPLRRLKDGCKGKGIGTLHLQNKFDGEGTFTTDDEVIALVCSLFVGELMSRIDDLSWVDNFYDPITQHILAPFTPLKKVTLPPVNVPPLPPRSNSSSRVGSASSSQKKAPLSSAAIESKLLRKMNQFGEEFMIRRDLDGAQQHEPQRKQNTSSLEMPTLREVKSYMDNMQDCWKKSVSANVSLKEDDRSTQIEVKVLRRQLREAETKLAQATERLRLYELQGKDYSKEYAEMRREVQMYAENRDTLLM